MPRASGRGIIVDVGEPGVVLRPTARVLVVDDLERVLLFRSVDRHGEGFWFPAGGGIEAGETAEHAAVREVAEETGLRLDDGARGALVEVWRRAIVAMVDGVTYDFRERWFLLRVPRFAVDTGGFTAEEERSIGEHRWWTVGDLHRSEERLVPMDLAVRLEGLLRDGPPPAPVEIGR